MLICGIMVSSLFSYAQQEINLLNTPYVSVIGESHIEITPDEIYVRFTLLERYDGKTKVELSTLDKALFKQLKSNGFNLDALTVADATLNYTPVRRKTEDVLASKTYKMKLTKLSELTKLWQILDEIEVKNATVYKMDLSNRKDIEQAMRAKAVQDAKQKAEGMLEAIGERVYKVLYLEEQVNYARPFQARSVLFNTVSEKAVGYSEDSAADNAVEFEKIRIECKVQAKFSIK